LMGPFDASMSPLEITPFEPIALVGPGLVDWHPTSTKAMKMASKYCIKNR